MTQVPSCSCATELAVASATEQLGGNERDPERVGVPPVSKRKIHQRVEKIKKCREENLAEAREKLLSSATG
jgi:hypothetical protein